MVDLDKVTEFGEYIHACEKCAREAVRPWKVACAVLAAVLAVAACWHQPG